MAGWIRRASLVLAPLLLAAPALAEGSWYAQRITSGDAPLSVEFLWSKGPKLRTEQVVGGHPIVTLVIGERYVMYDRVTGEGVSIQRSPDAISQDATRGRPFANEYDGMQAAGAEKVGTERFSGRKCDLYRLTDGSGRREICVVTEENLPIVTRVYLRRTASEVVTRYAEWSREVNPPDSFFLPPPDVKLEAVSYQDYLRRAPKERIGPSPPTHRELLHGERN
jgi:hypothetical protein